MAMMWNYFERLADPAIRRRMEEEMTRERTPEEVLQENLRQAEIILPDFRMAATSSFVSRADRQAARKMVADLEDLIREGKAVNRRTAVPASKL